MGIQLENKPSTSAATLHTDLPWWKQATHYQWLVLFVAWLGWVFDSMDATIYALVQTPALTELLGARASKEAIGWYGGIIFSIFVAGWAMGGVVFGILADYFGRARVLVMTILIYALFTGAAALAHTWWGLGLYRFISALGIGGEWAAGAALVAEVWPERARAKAAGVLQSAWAGGFFLAALINLFIGTYGWRVMFLIGIIPALVALVIRLTVKEPERWLDVKKQREEKKSLQATSPEASPLTRFTLHQLFEPGLRRDTIIGSLLAFVAVFGLWGATNWTPSIVRDMLAPGQLSGRTMNDYVSFAVMSLNVGALFGYLAFGPLADRWGRKPTFFLMMLGSAIMLPVVFLTTKRFTSLLVLLPLLGFFNNGIFSGFPIYFPELFPTPVRTTGAGFCFNVGRVIAAAGPFITGALVFHFGSFGKAASTISVIYFVGMITLLFARETKGVPLE